MRRHFFYFAALAAVCLAACNPTEQPGTTDPKEDPKSTECRLSSFVVNVGEGTIDAFIDQVEKVETYNRVMAEQTEKDRRKFYHQQKKVREFNTYVDNNMVPALGTMEAERNVGKTDSQADEPEEIKELTADMPGTEPIDVFTDDETEEDILQRAIDMI